MAVPVLYYHRINDIDPPPHAISPSLFEEQIKFLASEGWITLSPTELTAYLNGKVTPPKKSLMLTFDDGYLDNWVFAYPILKKYKMKATIFLITSRITDSQKARPNYEDVVQGKVGADKLPRILSFDEANRKGLSDHDVKAEGFLVWEEVKIMFESGLISFESHSHTHSSHYISDKMKGIVDSDKPHWSLLLPLEGDVRLGVPVYEKASALVGKRYYDDKKIRNIGADFVIQRGGAEYFYKMGHKKMRKMIEGVVKDYRKNHGTTGHYEKEEDRKKRVYDELYISKQVIEAKLGYEPKAISWPWGHFDEVSIKIAQEIGYAIGFSIRSGAVTPGMHPYKLRRLKVEEWSPAQLDWRLKFLASELAPLINVFSR